MRRNFKKLDILTFGLKQCFYLTRSARQYFEELAFKKTKTCNFKWLHLKSQDEFRDESNIFRNFIQFFSKQGCFLLALPTWVQTRGLRPLGHLVLLLVARQAQKVNGEPVKVLNLLFFVYFIFYFWTKEMLLLNPFSPGIL